jgi:DDE family transposase
LLRTLDAGGVVGGSNETRMASAMPTLVAPLLDGCLSDMRAEAPGKERRISRWEYEAVQDRLDCNPDKMRVRRQTVEHPFGTIKAWMGATHFQMRRLPKVASEMALHVLAYNMKRVMQILGVGGLMVAMRA